MDSDTIHTHHHPHDDELPESGSTVTRRTFMKAAGFTIAVAAAGCERPPAQHALPHKRLSPEATPGTSSWYASTCGGCSAGCGVLAKNRDGRPIKLEGNPEHPVSRGGLCAVGQASILDVYDSQRFATPMLAGKTANWKTVDTDIQSALKDAASSGKRIWLMTGTVNGPTERAAIEAFRAAYPNARHAAYDALPVSAMLDAHEEAFGLRALPRIDFAKTKVIASFDADFLGTWYSPVEHTQGYRAARAGSLDEKQMARHIQYESRMSLTGSNADQRVAATPSEIGECIRSLHALLRAKAGQNGSAASGAPSRLRNGLAALAAELWNARGASAVVCGTNDIHAQRLCAEMNMLLGNYGTTLDLGAPSQQRLGSDAALAECLDDMRSGNVAVLLLYGANPVYDLPFASGAKKLIASVPTIVSFAHSKDETSTVAKYLCPVPHALEQWGDAEPVAGTFGLFQPAVQNLRDTRTFAESLLKFTGSNEEMYDIIREVWREKVHPACAPGEDFELFWRKSVQNGYAVAATPGTTQLAWRGIAAADSGANEAVSGMQLTMYPKVAILGGAHSGNPWLQEMPDPITKIVWDNYACISLRDAETHALAEGDVVKLSNGQTAFELPVHIQEGQADGAIAVALGYGRMGTERFKNAGPQWLEDAPTTGEHGLVGVRVHDALGMKDGARRFESSGWSLVPTGKHVDLAASQKYDYITEPKLLGYTSEAPRECLKETSLAAFVANPAAGSGKKHDYKSLWSGYDYNGHHWGMAIDLTACTGCSGCVVSCQAENNIPVVGKDEVRRHRFMHWIRIDRYYHKKKSGLTVAHQPMMCHQCDNAPCETVCPVLATAHSAEGLNQQVYNRCVGTRYCANNCPYKVRRFNWFDYKRDDEMANLVLNPDVTVRERGVMEKCSFCVQRIQEAKIRAKAEGRPLADGEALPACAQSCPANAIIFGDMNDPESEIAKAMKNPRHYYALEEVGTRPSLGYLTLVRNTGAKEA